MRCDEENKGCSVRLLECNRFDGLGWFVRYNLPACPHSSMPLPSPLVAYPTASPSHTTHPAALAPRPGTAARPALLPPSFLPSFRRATARSTASRRRSPTPLAQRGGSTAILPAFGPSTWLLRPLLLGRPPFLQHAAFDPKGRVAGCLIESERVDCVGLVD